MRIASNVLAMNTHRSYIRNNERVQSSAEKLSSGHKVNRAADDAAGLAISEKMRSQIRGITMAAKNSQDAVSLIQTAEGALQEVHSMLQRMNELAVQSATGTNERIDRVQIAKEFEQLKREMNDISEQTTFNNMKILDGSLSAKGLQRSEYTSGMYKTFMPLEHSLEKDAVSGMTITEAGTFTNGATRVSFEVDFGNAIIERTGKATIIIAGETFNISNEDNIRDMYATTSTDTAHTYPNDSTQNEGIVENLKKQIDERGFAVRLKNGETMTFSVEIRGSKLIFTANERRNVTKADFEALGLSYSFGAATRGIGGVSNTFGPRAIQNVVADESTHATISQSSFKFEPEMAAFGGSFQIGNRLFIFDDKSTYSKTMQTKLAELEAKHLAGSSNNTVTRIDMSGNADGAYLANAINSAFSQARVELEKLAQDSGYNDLKSAYDTALKEYNEAVLKAEAASSAYDAALKEADRAIADESNTHAVEIEAESNENYWTREEAARKTTKETLILECDNYYNNTFIPANDELRTAESNKTTTATTATNAYQAWKAAEAYEAVKVAYDAVVAYCNATAALNAAEAATNAYQVWKQVEAYCNAAGAVTEASNAYDAWKKVEAYCNASAAVTTASNAYDTWQKVVTFCNVTSAVAAASNASGVKSAVDSAKIAYDVKEAVRLAKEAYDTWQSNSTDATLEQAYKDKLKDAQDVLNSNTEYSSITLTNANIASKYQELENNYNSKFTDAQGKVTAYSNGTTLNSANWSSEASKWSDEYDAKFSEAKNKIDLLTDNTSISNLSELQNKELGIENDLQTAVSTYYSGNLSASIMASKYNEKFEEAKTKLQSLTSVATVSSNNFNSLNTALSNAESAAQTVVSKYDGGTLSESRLKTKYDTKFGEAKDKLQTLTSVATVDSNNFSSLKTAASNAESAAQTVVSNYDRGTFSESRLKTKYESLQTDANQKAAAYDSGTADVTRLTAKVADEQSNATSKVLTYDSGTVDYTRLKGIHDAKKTNAENKIQRYDSTITGISSSVLSGKYTTAQCNADDAARIREEKYKIAAEYREIFFKKRDAASNAISSHNEAVTKKRNAIDAHCNAHNIWVLASNTAQPNAEAIVTAACDAKDEAYRILEEKTLALFGDSGATTTRATANIGASAAFMASAAKTKYEEYFIANQRRLAEEVKAQYDSGSGTIKLSYAGNAGTAFNTNTPTGGMDLKAESSYGTQGDKYVKLDVFASFDKRDIGEVEYEIDLTKLKVGDVITWEKSKDDIATYTYKKDDTIKDIIYALGIEKDKGIVVDGNTWVVKMENKKIGGSRLLFNAAPDGKSGTYDAMQIQVGALEKDRLAIKIGAMNTKGLGLDDQSIYTQEEAGQAVTATRNAINTVSDQRALLGAIQNRMTHKITNLKTSVENLQLSESRIRDTDLASEMTSFTKNNILAQAATSMLAQANSSSQNVLSLLR